MLQFDQWSMTANVALFLLAAAAIAVAGWKLANLADRLSDRTGMGEALLGAVLLGATTSLSGIAASVTAAVRDHPELAVSNALGGITAQTAFLAIADLFYRRANLEHAAASVTNLMHGAILVSLLSLPLMAGALGEVAFWGVHPVSAAMLVLYLFGLRVASRVEARPLWKAENTSETRPDVPNEDSGAESLARLWSGFAALAVVVSVAGWVVARAGIVMADRTGLSETAVGGVLTAVSTSLPELVVSIAAVRQGALTLAVGNIIGGNTFDTLFLVLADVFYRDGSIYHAVTQRQTFLISLAILMTGILVMGMIRREKHGIANIGFESFLLLALYAGSLVVLFAAPGS